MRLLALDTATEACSVAIWQDGACIERFALAGRTHTQSLLRMVHELMAVAGLTFSQIDGFVCGVGPGSFAGVRIGVGFIKGMALALDRPVVGVTSLAMLAQGSIDAGASHVLAAIDARMNEVYVAPYQKDRDGLACSVAPAVVVAADQFILDNVGPWHAVGTGWGPYEATLRAGVKGVIARVDATALPRAATALKMACPQFVSGTSISAAELVPMYLRNKVALTVDEQVDLRNSKAGNTPR